MILSDEQLVFLLVQQYFLSFGIDILLTGIYTCMIFFILYYFCSSRSCRAQKSSKILTGVILLMFVLRIIHVGIFWYHIWFAFVEHGDSRDSVLLAVAAPPLNLVFSNVTGTLLTAIADTVMVWRCWILSDSSVKVTLLPFILNFLAIVFGFAVIVCNRLGPGGAKPSVAILMSTLNMAFSVATTIVSTLIITIRILIVGRVPGDIRAQKRFSKPLAIIIESSALYTIAFIIYIPFFATPSDFTLTTSVYIDSIAQNMTVIAPALIMLRVLMSKACPEQLQHRSESKITTLQFEHGSGSSSAGEQTNAGPVSGPQGYKDMGMETWHSDQNEKETV